MQRDEGENKTLLNAAKIINNSRLKKVRNGTKQRIDQNKQNGQRIQRCEICHRTTVIVGIKKIQIEMRVTRKKMVMAV
jgi:hypothetical protein